jgi:hypothetical protein
MTRDDQPQRGQVRVSGVGFIVCLPAAALCASVLDTNHKSSLMPSPTHHRAACISDSGMGVIRGFDLSSCLVKPRRRLRAAAPVLPCLNIRAGGDARFSS